MAEEKKKRKPYEVIAPMEDDTDISLQIRDMMDRGAPASEVASALQRRVNKALTTEGLEQYAYDDFYDAAMDYIINYNNNQKPQESFTYESAPQYVNKYKEKIDALAQTLLGSSYEDFLASDTYKSLADRYRGMGELAMKDTLGQISARTGGIASSYAALAGQQAYNQYMNALEQAAYDMYMGEQNRQRQNLDMLTALERGDYAKYQDLLNQYNLNRNFDYGRYMDELAQRNYEQSRLDNLLQQNISNAMSWENIQYQRERDKENTQYARSQDAAAFARQLALQQIAAGMVPDDTLLAAAGISPDYAQSMADYYRQQAVTGTAGGAIGSSPAFKDVVAKAKNYDDPEEAEEYVNRQVEAGNITPDEAVYIFEVILGLSIDEEDSGSPFGPLLANPNIPIPWNPIGR